MTFERIQLIERQNYLNTISVLFMPRLHHYMLIMKAALIRYKQGIVILFALLAPTLLGINYFLTAPILSFISNNGLSSIFLDGSVVYAIYISWILLQKPAVKPVDANTYISTLPISNFTNRFIDILMLLVANNVFLIPFILVIPHLNFSDWSILKLLFLVISVLSFQVNFVKFSIVNIFFLVIANSLYFYSCVIQYVSLEFSLIIFCNAIALQTLLIPLPNYNFFNLLHRSKRNSAFKNINLRAALLCRTKILATLFRLALSMLVILTGILLVTKTKLSSNVFVVSIVILGICSFVLSGILTFFYNERKLYAGYLNSYPRSNLWWISDDIFFVSIVQLLISLIYFFGILFYFNMGFYEISLILFYQVILLSMLYYFRTQFQIFGMFVSLLITCLWVLVPTIIKGIL
ncbi:MAG: hypothetical protein Q8L78_05330 [Coxiellaceae bacterium]|nr:hypothetical protein [Coxiellaceae bacterium]